MEEVKVPGTDVVDYESEEVEFLEAYSKAMNLPDVCKALKWSQQKVMAYAKKEHLARALVEMQEARMEAWKLNATMVSAKHVRIQDKLERKFDEGELGVASALVKASAESLKAVGVGASEGVSSGAKVTVNISLGGSAVSPSVVDAEVVDE